MIAELGDRGCDGAQGPLGPRGHPGLPGRPGDPGECGIISLKLQLQLQALGVKTLNTVLHTNSTKLVLGINWSRRVVSDKINVGSSETVLCIMAAGSKGSKGLAGKTGPSGRPGLKGDSGDPGLPGQQGTKSPTNTGQEVILVYLLLWTCWVWCITISNLLG